MAKGDSGRAQNAINYQGGLAQSGLTNFQNQFIPQNQEAYNAYQRSLSGAQDSYNNIMGQYNQFMNRGPLQTNFNPEYSGYQNFSQTGGYSPEDIQNIRARSIAPTRAIYQQGINQLQRQSELSGNAANVPAAISRMAREQNYAIGDQNVNANAAIAQMVQQGKLAGLGGMSSIDQARLQGELQNQGMNLAGLQGQSALYSATPGMAGLTGSMYNNAQNQWLSSLGLQNQLSLGLIGNQINKSAIPGNYQQALGNIGGTLGAIGQIGGAISPWLKMGSPTYQPLAPGADPYSGIGAMGENGPSGLTSTSTNPGSTPWWQSLLGSSSGAGNFNPNNAVPGNMQNPYSWMINNPNAWAMNPYIGSVFGGGIGGGQGGYKLGPGGPV